MATLEDRVRLLEDERDILRTLYTYGHAIDYDLEAEFLDCWAEDALLNWGSNSFRGEAEIRTTFRAHTHAPSIYHKHLLSEPLIQIDGDRARAQSMFARVDSYPEGPKVLAIGRYRDVLVRSKDGRWRFAERHAEVESIGTPPQGVIDAMQPGAPTNA